MCLPSRGRFEQRAFRFGFVYMRRENSHDRAGYFVLNSEDIIEFTIVPLCPTVGAALCVDELRCDANALASAADATLKHVVNTELAANEGHVKVAVKVTDNGDGTYRYDYAVMNFDFARAVTEAPPAGGGPDPRVLSNKGFDSFAVPAGGTIGATTFSNGTLDTTGLWSEGVSNGVVTWTAPDGGSLDWGTMYSYSITSSSAPVAGNATLHVAQSGTPATYDVATLVPGSSVDPNDPVFNNGFDP